MRVELSEMCERSEMSEMSEMCGMSGKRKMLLRSIGLTDIFL